MTLTVAGTTGSIDVPSKILWQQVTTLNNDFETTNLLKSAAESFGVDPKVLFSEWRPNFCRLYGDGYRIGNTYAPQRRLNKYKLNLTILTGCLG